LKRKAVDDGRVPAEGGRAAIGGSPMHGE